MNGVSIAQTSTSCACSDPDCRTNGCRSLRQMLGAQRGAPTPQAWNLSPPALGYRYRIEPSGVVYYERDPSFSFASMHGRGCAAVFPSTGAEPFGDIGAAVGAALDGLL